jgi:WD40 repeat protein
VLRQEGAVTAAAFDPAGRRLLTAGADGTAKTWDARSGTLLQTMAAGGPVASASWARGGRVVVTGSTRGALRLWRARDGRRLRSFQAEVATPLAKAVVDPAATQVVTVSRDRFARVYSLATGHLTRSIPHGGFVGAVAFSPDGRLLLTADYTGAVRLWEARSGKLVRSLLGGQRNIPDAVFSPDGTRVAAASADGTARIWDVSTGLQMAIAIGRGANTAVAFNRDATAIVTTSIDGTARVWGAIPANGGRPLAVLTGHTGPVVAAGFSPDGRAVVTASEDGTARVWDPASEPDFSIAARRRSPLTALAIRSDRRRLLVGGADGIAEVRSADGKRVVRTLRLGHAVTAVAFGPQGAEAVDAPRTAIAFSPDGKLKAVAEGSTVRIASPTGPPSHTLRIGRIVHDLAFSPDGDDLAVALGNGTAQVWDAVAARRRLTLAGHKRPVVGIAFNSDGTLIATVSGQDVWLWDARTGEVMRKLQGPNARDVQFSPDGHWLVAAGPTTTALWELDVKTENVPGFLRASVERPFSAAGFGGPDGRLIIATSLDGTLRVFHCDLCGRARELLALAKRRIAAES